MTATPTWFGPSDQPLFGWLHAPDDGRVHGGVVICPPLGKEHISAYPTLRLLADRLADRRIAAFRFDYLGTGDSSGDLSGPDKVASWLTNIVDAVRLLRGAGIERVALVGLRMGATLAATAAAQCAPLAALACWDPCESGAAFLREQRALYRFSVARPGDAQPADGSIETPGFVYGRATAAALKSVELGSAPAGSVFEAVAASRRPILFVARDDRGAAVGPWSTSPDVEEVEASGQAELFGVPSYDAQVPYGAVDRIVDYLDERMPGSPGEQVTLQFEPRNSAVVGVDDSGAEVIETVRWFGDRPLFGIVTEPRGGGGLALLCTNVATEHHIGPSRLWVDLARRLALAGRTSVRFDYFGVGDSIYDVPPGPERRTYSGESWGGVLEVARAMSPTDPADVAYAGLCSGSWAAARAAIECPPRAVYLINQAIWQRSPTPVGGAALAAGDDSFATEAHQRVTLKHLVRQAVKRTMPFAVYRLLGRLGVLQVPHTLLYPLVRAGTRVTLILGEEDGAAFFRQRGPTSARKLGRVQPIRLRHVDEADHSLLRRTGRDLVIEELVRAITADLGEPAAATGSGGDNVRMLPSCGTVER